MLTTLLRAVTWWNGGTLATFWDTRRNGVRVGEDELGNTYYQTKDGKRRWVMFAGESEASKVTPDWHGWLHHTWDTPPTETPMPRHAWEKPHQPNMTGTEFAYRPPGSLLSPETRPTVAGDYEAWKPD